MNLSLQGHVALVQGASKGLGRGVAEALAAEGVNLLLTARTAASLQATAQEIARTHGVKVHTVAADSADLSAIPALVEAVQQRFGRLDILVCNSGGPPPGPFLSLDAEKWQAACQLLLTAPSLLLQQALPLLRQSPAPRFFVITSSSTRQGVPGLTLSNVFRPGVYGLVKYLADELAADRVRCHSIAPGRFDTDRLGHVIAVQAEKQNKSREEVKAAMIASIPAGRLGEPTELGSLVAYLSSPRADYLTGQNWMVDGGLVRSL